MNVEKKYKRGEELNSLSRLLFDEAAKYWYFAICAEFILGFTGALFLGVLSFSSEVNLVIAIIFFIIWIASYISKLVSENYYDNAETMRRQSVLTEGLGWEISQTLFSKWRLKAGSNILKKLEINQRADDYYTTKDDVGPVRLLEMVAESAFYTRHLYLKLKKRAWFLFISIFLLAIIILGFSSIEVVSSNFRTQLVYFIFLFLPVILSIDLLRWAIKLGQLSDDIYDIENKFELLSKKDDIDTAQVMRLVSEYNCQVVQGIPIHNWLFKRWHNEIKLLWGKTEI